jgi:hypothetical protein
MNLDRSRLPSPFVRTRLGLTFMMAETVALGFALLGE